MKRCLLAFALWIVASTAFAVALPITPLWSGLLDNSGQPLAGGRVYFYKAGTHTAKTVWDEAAKITGRTSVVLDAYGRAEVYGDMADSCRYDLEVYGATATSELYHVYGLEVVSAIAPTTFSPTNLTSVVKGEIASLTVSQRANLASTTINVFHLSNGTMIQSDLTNVDIASASLSTAFLSTDMNANGYTIASLAVPVASSDAATKLYVDTLSASTTEFASAAVGAINDLTAQDTSDYNRMSRVEATQTVLMSRYSPSNAFFTLSDVPVATYTLTGGNSADIDAAALTNSSTIASQVIWLSADVQWTNVTSLGIATYTAIRVYIKKGTDVVARRSYYNLSDLGGRGDSLHVEGMAVLSPSETATFKVTIENYGSGGTDAFDYALPSVTTDPLNGSSRSLLRVIRMQKAQ